MVVLIILAMIFIAMLIMVVVAVLVITYGLAAMMWNNYPDRFLTFATSELGSMFIGLSIFLQAVGLFWISRISRIEV